MNKVSEAKFAVLYKTKKPLKVLMLKIPKCQKNQLLIKIKYSFICGSQMNEIYGYKGKDIYIPHVLGHEASGYVVDKGLNVNNFKKMIKYFCHG